VNRDNYARYVDEIRSTILEHGYRGAITAWIRSVPLRMMTAENQDESFRFFLWTRNLFILFERHGAVRSREVLELMDPDLIKPGQWSQADAYEAWLQHRNATNATDEARHALRGWVNLTRTELERGRQFRARMHSLDAFSDVLHEPTESDAEFIAVLGDVSYNTDDGSHAGGEAATAATQEEVTVEEEAPEAAVEVVVTAEIENNVEL
jgi:hypothetical protein